MRRGGNYKLAERNGAEKLLEGQSLIGGGKVGFIRWNSQADKAMHK